MSKITWAAVLSLSMAGVSCSSADKDIDDDNTDLPADGDADADSDADADADLGPFHPAAIGFEWSGNWDEASGELTDYLFPDLNNENGGEPSALSQGVWITLATADFFSMDAEDPDRDNEQCTMFADFSWFQTTFTTQEFDWEGGSGGTGEIVSPWASYGGALWIREDSIGDRCDDWADADAYSTFNGTHFGVAFGARSSYQTEAFEEADWWDPEDHGVSYFTQYIAVNHPNDEATLGWDFVGYDWTSAIYVEADPEVCVEFEESGTSVCGLVQTEEEDGSTVFKTVSFEDDVGTRFAHLRGNAWWYEDFPNLDLGIMTEGNGVEK